MEGDFAICQNLTDGEICSVCASTRRDKSTVCVVAEPRDVVTIERSREYNGTYHVLHGVLSPMSHIGPDDLRISELVERISAGEIKDLQEGRLVVKNSFEVIEVE